MISSAPSESRSKFVSTTPGDIGKPAQAVSRHRVSGRLDHHRRARRRSPFYQSSPKGFAVTLDPANQAAVTAADLAEVKAVARAIAKG